MSVELWLPLEEPLDEVRVGTVPEILIGRLDCSGPVSEEPSEDFVVDCDVPALVDVWLNCDCTGLVDAVLVVVLDPLLPVSAVPLDGETVELVVLGWELLGPLDGWLELVEAEGLGVAALLCVELV